MAWASTTWRIGDRGRHDELDELANAFDSMADSIAETESRRQELVSNLSHELKTPMTTISGFADGILDGTIPPTGRRTPCGSSPRRPGG